MSALGVRNALGRIKQWRERRKAIASGAAHPLSMARAGRTYRIVGVAGRDKFQVCSCFRADSTMDSGTCLRVLEMGIVPGVCITVLGNGDPMILGLWGGRTALGRSLARDIFVSAIPMAEVRDDWHSEERAA